MRTNCVNCGAPLEPICSYCGTPTAPTRAEGGGTGVSGGEYVVPRYGHAVTRPEQVGRILREVEEVSALSSSWRGANTAPGGLNQQAQQFRDDWDQASLLHGMANAYAAPPPAAPEFESGRGGDFAGAGADGSWSDGP